MDGTDQTGMQRTSGVFGSQSHSGGTVPKPPIRFLNSFNQIGTSCENQKHGIPPSHPNSTTAINLSPSSSPYPQFIIPSQSQTQSQQPHSGSQRVRSPNLTSRSSSSNHSRSLSQPSIFSLDSLPPLSPMPYGEPSVVGAVSPFSGSVSPADVSMEESFSLATSHAPSSMALNSRGSALQLGHSLPPRKGHRRSSSDTPLGISDFTQCYPQQLVSPGALSDRETSSAAFRRESSNFEKPIQLVLKEPLGKGVNTFGGGESVNLKKEDDTLDDLFSAYMNLDNIDNMNNLYGMEDKDLDSRTSGSKTVESSDNEVESRHENVKTSGGGGGGQGGSSSYLEERREGVKRSSNGDIAPGARHRRSYSLDSSIGNFRIEDGSPKLPPLQQTRVDQLSPSNSMDGKTSEAGMEFGNAEFSSEEMKKIMESDKLAEIALSDPKRAKRILANRLSAARSKERKTRYISELENKVQTLQTETTTLSTQFTKLQMDNSELKTQNNEYKLRLQALEQQSQLKDALNEALDAEVRRLRRTVAELGGESLLSSRVAQQLAVNNQMFQLQNQQPSQPRHFQMQNNSHPQQEQTQTQSQKIQHSNEMQSQWKKNDKATAY